MSKLKVSAIHDPDNDNEAITVDTSGNVGVSQDASFSGNVGVGTTSPSSPLHIAHNSDTSESFLTVEDTDTTAGSQVPHIKFLGNGSQLGYLRCASTGFSLFNSSGTENLRLKDDGTLQYNSGYGSFANAYGCRAWVNFDGTGTASINESANVSSVTDNGGYVFTINFSTSMVDANYCAVFGGRDTTSGAEFISANASGTYSTSAIQIKCWNYAGGGVDMNVTNVAIFR